MRKPPHRRGQAEILYLQARTSRRIVGFAVALATGWAGMSQTDIDMRAIGTVVSRNGLVAIGTPAAGIVGASYLAPGRAVAAGEALVQMDDGPARERLADIGKAHPRSRG